MCTGTSEILNFHDIRTIARQFKRFEDIPHDRTTQRSASAQCLTQNVLFMCNSVCYYCSLDDFLKVKHAPGSKSTSSLLYSADQFAIPKSNKLIWNWNSSDPRLVKWKWTVFCGPFSATYYSANSSSSARFEKRWVSTSINNHIQTCGWRRGWHLLLPRCLSSRERKKIIN